MGELEQGVWGGGGGAMGELEHGVCRRGKGAMGELEHGVCRRGKGQWVNWNMVCVGGKGGNGCSGNQLCVIRREFVCDL